MTIKEDNDRYLAAAHAMQTGVKFEMAKDFGKEHDPSNQKQLRVGVNSALVSQAGLVQLLISKGVITEVEYYHSQMVAMETEVARYEARANRGNSGPEIHFG